MKNKKYNHITASILCIFYTLINPNSNEIVDNIYINIFSIITILYAFSFIVYLPISFLKKDLDFSKVVFYFSIIILCIAINETRHF